MLGDNQTKEKQKHLKTTIHKKLHVKYATRGGVAINMKTLLIHDTTTYGLRYFIPTVVDETGLEVWRGEYSYCIGCAEQKAYRKLTELNGDKIQEMESTPESD